MHYQISENFFKDLKEIKGNFSDYKRFLNKSYSLGRNGVEISFIHIQNSPDAMPASLLEIKVPFEIYRIKEENIFKPYYRLALSDFIARLLIKAIKKFTLPSAGFGSSGSFQLPDLSQEILDRNIVVLYPDKKIVSIWMMMSFPSKNKRFVDIDKTKQMISRELPDVLAYLEYKLANDTAELETHIQVVKDYYTIQSFLENNGFVCFIANGSNLARKSGNSDLPLQEGFIPFKSPQSLLITIKLDKDREISGMAIPKGITVITGAGYHGKSTLMNAIIKGVYPHVPGDGREYVVTIKDAVKIKAEDGRSIKRVDLSSFIKDLPFKKETNRFSTELASGSTSQAASFVEFATSGVKTFLIDEDDSATNFLFQDNVMRKVIRTTSIIPLSDFISLLKDKFKISLILIAGASSIYLEKADLILEMFDYEPYDITERVRELLISQSCGDTVKELNLIDSRLIDSESFLADYFAKRHNKLVKNRIKVLRGTLRKLEFGNEILDLSAIATIVETYQIEAIGWLLLYAKKKNLIGKFEKIEDIVFKLFGLLDGACLREISAFFKRPLYLTVPRKEDLVAAINRFRGLKLKD